MFAKNQHTTWKLNYRIFAAIITPTILLLSTLFTACGTQTDQETNDVPITTVVDENAIATIPRFADENPDLRASTRPSSIFTIDDFINAGWKQNKEFSVETLPQAEGAWFGFYNRKDIEIRIYPSHEIAMVAGVESAETALETEKISGRGAGFSAVTLYGAYIIAGNTVMLCEVSIQDCIDLLEQIDK